MLLSKRGERLAEVEVLDAELAAKGNAGNGSCGSAEQAEETIGERVGWWGLIGRGAPEVRCRAVGPGGEDECDGIWRGRGAVFEGQQDLVVSACEVGGGVGPGPQVRGAAQCLTEVAPALLAHVVDERDRKLVLTRQRAQEAEQLSNVSSVILVAGMKSHQRIEEQETRREVRDGGGEAFAVARIVEPQRSGGDDVQRDAIDGQVAQRAQGGDALAHARQGILGEEDEDGTRGLDGKSTEAVGAGCDRDSEVEAEPGLPDLGMAGNEADGRVGPQVADEPRFVGRLRGKRAGLGDRKLVGEPGGRRHGYGHRSLRAPTTCWTETVAWPAAAA